MSFKISSDAHGFFIIAAALAGSSGGAMSAEASMRGARV